MSQVQARGLHLLLALLAMSMRVLIAAKHRAIAAALAVSIILQQGSLEALHLKDTGHAACRRPPLNSHTAILALDHRRLWSSYQHTRSWSLLRVLSGSRLHYYQQKITTVQWGTMVEIPLPEFPITLFQPKLKLPPKSPKLTPRLDPPEVGTRQLILCPSSTNSTEPSRNLVSFEVPASGHHGFVKWGHDAKITKIGAFPTRGLPSQGKANGPQDRRQDLGIVSECTKWN